MLAKFVHIAIKPGLFATQCVYCHRTVAYSPREKLLRIVELLHVCPSMFLQQEKKHKPLKP